MTASSGNSSIDNLNIFYNDTRIPSKVCTKCKQIKSITEYSKNKRKSDGLESSCKSCQSIKLKHYQDNNKQINANKIYNKNDVKICSACNQSKSIIEYCKDKINSDGSDYICKSFKSIKEKRYRDNNRQNNTNRTYTENDVKTCCRCKQQKLYTKLKKCLSNKTGLESYCKNCTKYDTKEHFQNLFNKSLSRSIKFDNCSCVSIMGYDPHF